MRNHPKKYQVSTFLRKQVYIKSVPFNYAKLSARTKTFLKLQKNYFVNSFLRCHRKISELGPPTHRNSYLLIELQHPKTIL